MSITTNLYQHPIDAFFFLFFVVFVDFVVVLVVLLLMLILVETEVEAPERYLQRHQNPYNSNNYINECNENPQTKFKK